MRCPSSRLVVEWLRFDANGMTVFGSVDIVKAVVPEIFLSRGDGSRELMLIILSRLASTNIWR